VGLGQPIEVGAEQLVLGKAAPQPGHDAPIHVDWGRLSGGRSLKAR
jgi:hypothetical protein